MRYERNMFTYDTLKKVIVLQENLNYHLNSLVSDFFIEIHEFLKLLLLSRVPSTETFEPF